MDAGVDIQVEYELLDRNFEITQNSPNGEIRTSYEVTNITDHAITQLSLYDILNRQESSALKYNTGFEPDVVDRGLPAFGQRRPSLQLNASRLIPHPTEPRLLALMYQDHSITVIDTGSQQVEKVVWVGTHPTGGAFSADHSEFFVATSTASQLSVLNATTWELARIVELEFTPLDIAIGAGGQLLISDGSRLHQVDPQTGNSVGTTIDEFNTDRVHLLADGKTVIAPTSDSRFAREYDLSIDPPGVKSEIEARQFENYDGDLRVTPDDRLILQRATYRGNNFGISVFDRQSMAFAAFLPLENLDFQYTISSDSRFVYVENGGQVKVWNLHTLEPVGTFDVYYPFGPTSSISLDSNDEFLYWAQPNTVRIFTAGRTKGDTAESYASWNQVVDPGESWHFEYEWSYYDGQNPNNRTHSQGKVTALATFDGRASESVLETYEIDVDLEQLHLQAGYRTATSPSLGPSIVREGEIMTWILFVDASGPFSYRNVEVVGVFGDDRKEFPARYIEGDRNLNGSLDQFETWKYEVTETTGAGHGHSEFRAVSTSLDEDVPQAVGYVFRDFMLADGALDLDFRVVAPKDADAETVGQLRASSGDPMRWQYRVTNTGNYPIADFVIQDTRNQSNDSGFIGHRLDRVDTVSKIESSGDYVLRYPSERNITPQALALHPTQALLFFADGRKQEIVAYNYASDFPEYSIDIGHDVRRLIFDPYWERLYFITNEGVVRVIDVPSRRLLTAEIATSAVDIAVDSSGDLFVYKNDSIDRYSPRRFERISSIQFESFCGRIAIQDQYLAVHTEFAPNRGVAVFDIRPRTPIPLWNTFGVSTRSGGCDSGTLAFTEDADGEAYVYAYGPIDQERAMIVKRRLRDGHNVGSVEPFGKLVFASTDERRLYKSDELDGVASAWHTDTLQRADVFHIGDSSFNNIHVRSDTEVVLDDQRGLMIIAGSNEIGIVSTGRPANGVLAGDDNFNGSLDPGETWLFEIAGTAATGEHEVTATLSWADPMNRIATSIDAASYVATSQPQSITATVSANVAGIDVVDLADRALIDTIRNLTTTHPDFEIVDGILKLSPMAYASVAGHDGLRLSVENAQTQERLAEVLIAVTENSFAFHNVVDRFDVNVDGNVTALDALTIINAMARGIAGQLPSFRYVDVPFYDVNRDASLSTLDALQIVNQLARQRVNSEFESNLTPIQADLHRHGETVDSDWIDLQIGISLF